MKHSVAVRACAVLVAAATLTGVGVSSASASTPKTTTLTVSSTTPDLTGSQWLQVADRTQAAGDSTTALQIRGLVNQGAIGSQHDPWAEQKSIPTAIAKKALIALLRHGGPALAQAIKKLSPKAGKWVANNSGRLADFLDAVNNWQKGPLIIGLQHLGMPYDVANDLADWIIFFIGV